MSYISRLVANPVYPPLHEYAHTYTHTHTLTDRQDGKTAIQMLSNSVSAADRARIERAIADKAAAEKAAAEKAAAEKAAAEKAAAEIIGAIEVSKDADVLRLLHSKYSAAACSRYFE